MFDLVRTSQFMPGLPEHQDQAVALPISSEMQHVARLMSKLAQADGPNSMFLFAPSGSLVLKIKPGCCLSSTPSFQSGWYGNWLMLK